MKIKEKIKKFALIFLLVLSFLQSTPTIQAYAFGGIGIKTEFDSLDGDGKYLGSEYRSNYKLDLEELGITEVPEKMFNSIANAIFNIISFLGFAAAAFFYYALDFDLASLLQPQINKIQETLHNGFFTPMLQLVIVGAIILAICKYARRDFVGLLEQLGKVCFIMVLSVLVVSDSSKFLSYATSVTKGASVSILTGINDIDVGENVNNYAANAASVLWISLVHEPWKALEFGDYNYTNDDVEFFLTASGSERKDRVAEMMDGDKGPFSKDRSAIRVGQGLIILLTVFVKVIVYIVVSAMCFLFQVVAIFFILMAPLILLLSLVPGYDFELLGVWARKIMETQVGVLIITFLIGVMVFFDRALQALASEIGWFIVLIMQIAVCACLYLFRWQIFMAFNNAQRSVQNPRLSKRQLLRSGNPYSAIERQFMYHQAQQATGYKKMKKESQGEEGRSNGASSGILSRYARLFLAGPPQQKIKRPNFGDQNTAQGQNTARTEDLGREGSYYAPREVTDNWRDLWNNANVVKRPTTLDNSKVINRRPVLSQANNNSSAQAARRRREAAKMDRGYSRIAEDKKRPMVVGYEGVTDNRPVSNNGNVIMMPQANRTANSQNTINSRPSNALAIMDIEPPVSRVSFSHDPVQIPRNKINPARVKQINKRLRAVDQAYFNQGMSHPPVIGWHTPQIDREAVYSQGMNRPTTEQFQKEVAVSRENVQYKTEVKTVVQNSTAEQPGNSRTAKLSKRPTTIKGEGENKKTASKINSNPVTTSKSINKPIAQKSSEQIHSYNSAQSKIADTAIRELNSSQINVKRPETAREGGQEKKVNYISANRSESKSEKQKKDVKPVTQSYTGSAVSRKRSKPELRKPIKTAPNVQKATVSGFKAYKGNSGQGNERKP